VGGLAGVQRKTGGKLTIRLLGRTEIRHLARDLDFRPRKSLGQNFVHDANTVRRVVSCSGINRHDHVLEVGPGLGSLTLGLLDRGATVTAVEVDPVLAERLPKTIAEHSHSEIQRLAVLNRDILTLKRSDLDTEPTALVANLPYNIAVPVLLHLLELLPSLRTALVLVQAEVADRLAAGPGTPAYGVPSVKAAWYADVRRAGNVPRPVFWPVPNVDSGLVALTRRPSPPGDRAATFAAIDAAFATRRKGLRAALARWAGSPAAAEIRLRAAGIDPTTRGEQLSVTDFARLAATEPVPAEGQ
jgi:16S rRNA (adenine1518-N6/adenine1519-N6)-dimethyltransferase